MAVEVHPATEDRFADVARVLGPKRPDANVCWCLSHRVDSRTNRELVGPARGEYVRTLTRQPVAPGVLGYLAGEVAGWAAIAPRAGLPFARSARIPQIDDLPRRRNLGTCADTAVLIQHRTTTTSTTRSTTW